MKTTASICRPTPVATPPTTVTITMSEAHAQQLLNLCGLGINGVGPLMDATSGVYDALKSVGLNCTTDNGWFILPGSSLITSKLV